MKTSAHSQQSRAAFTLGETMVAIGMAGVVAVAASSMFLNGSILFAKNTAENLSHDQNRLAVNRLVRDIHSAVSTPQLGKIVTGNLAANPTAPPGSWTVYGQNLTFWAESGTGPAAGISFKKMGRSGDPNGGPYEVKNDPGNKDMIQIDSGSHAPFVGSDIIFPYYNAEGRVTKVTSNGANHYNVWIEGGLETRIKTKKNSPSVVCYYMSRYAYVVENGNLNLYSSSPGPGGISWPVTIARNIVSTPNKDNYTQILLNQDSFSPANIQIKRGEGVDFKWNTEKMRGVTCPGKFTSQKVKDGGENNVHFYHTFTESGTFPYYQTDNVNAKGVITVTPSDSQNVKPFSQATPDYVTINLTTEDNRYSNRNFKAVNTLLAGSVPIRAKISKTQ